MYAMCVCFTHSTFFSVSTLLSHLRASFLSSPNLPKKLKRGGTFRLGWHLSHFSRKGEDISYILTLPIYISYKWVCGNMNLTLSGLAFQATFSFGGVIGLGFSIQESNLNIHIAMWDESWWGTKLSFFLFCLKWLFLKYFRAPWQPHWYCDCLISS